MLNYKKKTDQLSNLPINNNTETKELKVSDLTNIEKVANSDKNNTNDIKGGGKRRNDEDRYIPIPVVSVPRQSYPLDNVIPIQNIPTYPSNRFDLGMNSLIFNPSINHNPTINPSIHQLSDPFLKKQFGHNDFNLNQPQPIIPTGANIPIATSRYGSIKPLQINPTKANGQDTYLINQEQDNIINAIIVETNSQQKKFMFFDRMRNYLGSFTIYEFIRCLTINTDPTFLSGIDCDTSRPVIEKYIAKIKTDDLTKKQTLAMLNYLESPFMGNVELLIKFYSYINEFEQTQFENELSKLQFDKRSKVRSIFDNMIYVLLNHILRIIGAISSKLQNNKNKDTLLNYSVAIVYRLSKYVRSEIEKEITTISELKTELATMEKTKTELNTRLDTIQRTIDRQNTEIELVLKNILIGKALGVNVNNPINNLPNSNTPSMNIHSHSGGEIKSDTTNTPSTNTNSSQSEQGSTSEQNTTEIESGIDMSDNYKNIYSSKDDESMIYSASNPITSQTKSNKIIGGKMTHNDNYHSDNHPNINSENKDNRTKNKLNINNEIHSFEDMLMSHTSNASNFEDYEYSDNYNKPNLKVKKHNKQKKSKSQSQTKTQLEYIAESPSVVSNSRPKVSCARQSSLSESVSENVINID
jgi:hypothetical protein